VAAYHLGFRDISVMHGGDKEWAARGYPFEGMGGTEDEDGID
jgi:3-mercaptopyruvate sulfurtransferase SseA